MVEKVPIDVNQLSEKEKLVLLSITDGIPLKHVVKHVEWSSTELKNTYRMLIWYLRYIFFYTQYKDYIRNKLEEILVVRKGARVSDWGKRLVLEMADFPIRNTGYWAQKMGYKQQGNASGSVLIALFVAEDRIEKFLEENMEDTTLRRWYLLFRSIQFGFMDFDRRFKYKFHLFKDLNEWPYVESELTEREVYGDRILRAEIKKRLGRGQTKEEIVGHMLTHYGIEPSKVRNIVNELTKVPPEEIVRETWEVCKDFGQTCKKISELGLNLTNSQIRKILLSQGLECIVENMMLEGKGLDAIRRDVLTMYGVQVSDSLLFRVKKMMERKNSNQGCFTSDGE